MRVTSNYYARLLNAVNATQERLQADVEQLSTGMRVNTPSDDPTASALEVQNLAASASVDQYEQNINSTQTLVQSASSALSSVVTSLTHAIAQAVEATSATMTSAQQSQMAATISGIRDQVISIANSAVQGVYLFGGTKSSAPPFGLNPDPTTGVTYSGNAGTNAVDVGTSQPVQVNVPGSQIFTAPNGNVMQSLTDLINSLQSGSTSGMQAATGALKSALDTISAQQQFYSGVSNQLSAQNTSLQSETVTLKSQENYLIGANVAAVATDLSLSQTSEQAALAAIAKVAPMSLINYIQ